MKFKKALNYYNAYKLISGDKEVTNEEINRENDLIAKLKEKVTITYRDTEYPDQACIVKIENFREPVIEEEGEGEDKKEEQKSINKSKTSQKQDDDQGFDQIPSRVLLVKPASDDLDIILVHTGKPIPLLTLLRSLKRIPKAHHRDLKEAILRAGETKARCDLHSHL